MDIATRGQRSAHLTGAARPPSVPAAVIAWLCTSPEANELNGTTVGAQRFALERRLHPDWRSTRDEEDTGG